VPEGFITDKDNVAKEFEEITVQGPKSVVDQITQAIINVTLTDQKESISQNYRYTLCNAEGAPVDAKLITTNTEEVHLDLIIHRIKDVKLVVKIAGGGGATEDTIKYTLDPQTIKVSGSDAALENLGDEIVLGTINLADYLETTEFTFAIPELEGVTNLSGRTEVTAKLSFPGLIIREYTIENFRISNLPEGMKAEIITVKLPVKIRGLAGDMNRLEVEDIIASVDFTDAQIGTSTFKVNLTFTEGFANLGAVGSIVVTATVTQE
jgi:YbbR domain-containing protein